MWGLNAMYPATMLNFGFLSRNVADPEKYRQIRDERIVLKRNKDARQGAYKIVLNSTYGASKDQYNPLYDPLMANNVCINGQLLLVDLLEKLEMKFGNKCLPINVNTDGILVKLESPDLYEEYLSVCKEWENRTGYELEHDLYKRVIGKDVNNYIIIDNDGNIKAKGTFVKKLSKLDYDLPILNKALKEYYINGVPVEETINNCDELIEFQKIVKISNKYLYSTYGDFQLKERMLRVFASTRPYAKGVFKAKQKGDAVVLEKIANTPEKCFIYNENVIGMKVTEELDKQYYINEAKKRIKSFTNEII